MIRTGPSDRNSRRNRIRTLGVETLEPRLALASFIALSDHIDDRFLSIDNAFDISEDGTKVVGHGTVPGGIEAYLWTRDGGIEGLGDLPGGDYASQALAISGDGNHVAGLASVEPQSSSDSGFRAFIWDVETAAIGELPEDVLFASPRIASGLSYDADVVVGSTAGRHAFVYSNGESIEVLTAITDLARVSNDGALAVFPSDSSYWQAGIGVVQLGNNVQPNDISGDGSTIVGAEYLSQAFRWTEQERFMPLGFSDALAVSDDGEVIVGHDINNETSSAYIWIEGAGPHDLKSYLQEQFAIDLAGWQLHQARAISGDGITIAGTGTNPNGQPDVWVVALNAPPVADAGGPYEIAEGSIGMVDASFSTDDDMIIAYHWDFDGDGHFDDAEGAIADFPVAGLEAIDGPNTVEIAVRVTDSKGLTDTDVARVSIGNVAPTATLSPTNITITEGEPVVLSLLNQFDPSTSDSGAGFRYSYDFDGDGTFDRGDGTWSGSSQSPSHSFSPNSLPDGPANKTVIVRILDVDGGYTDYFATIIIVNSPPVLEVGENQTLTLGQPISVSASFSDPGTNETYLARIRWGDGSTTAKPVVKDVDFDATHIYTVPGAYSVEICVNDGFEDACDSVDITVEAAIPEFHLTYDDEPIAPGDDVQIDFGIPKTPKPQLHSIKK